MSTIDDPVKNAEAVVQDTTFSYRTTGIYVGTGGNLQVVMEAGNTVTFNSVPSGALLPIRIVSVLSAGTTASNLVRLWN